MREIVKNRKRAIAIILGLIMILTAFVGCGKTDDDKPKETTVAEAKTFGGREFTIGGGHLHQQWVARPDESELEAEKQAIYDKFEADLDIKLEIIGIPGIHDQEAMYTSLMSGDMPADVVATKMATWLPLAIKGLILPLDDARLVEGGMNVNDPECFFQPFTQAHKHNGKVYAAMWNGSHFLGEFGWCIFFNKQLISEAGEDNLYQVVRDGKWDWDYFRQLAKKATVDLDKDGEAESYGVGTFGYGTELLTKPGAEFFHFDADGKVTVALNSAAALEALEFTRQFAYLDKIRHPEGYGDVHRAFTAGEVAMVWGEQWNSRADDFNFQTTDINFGLVPMPKAPGAEHYTNALGGVYSCQIFSGHKDDTLKDIGYIFSELGRRFTNDDWKATYRDVDLRGDEEALEMVLDYIWPHTVLDYTWASDIVRENFRNNIYLPMTEGQGTAAQLVEKHLAELQREVDILFGQ